MKITGLVHTLAPIHITAPSDPNVTKGNETTTVTMPLYDYETGKFSKIAGISATHLRGALRRIASDIYIERYRAAGVQISANLYNTQRHGSTNGKVDSNSRRGADYTHQLADPLMAAFGGGARMLPGHIHAAWALPLCRETARLNLVDVPGYIDPANLPEGWRLVTKHTAFSRLDMMNGQTVADILSDYAEVIGAILEAVDTRKKTKTAPPKSKEAGGEYTASAEPTDEQQDKLRGSNIITHELLIPGVLLNFSIGCEDHLSNTVKGFFLEVLRRYFEEGRVGGLQRIGYGVNTFNLQTVAGLTIDGQPLFTQNGEKLGFATTANPSLKPLIDAYADWHTNPETISDTVLLRAAGMVEASHKTKKAEAA